MEKLYGKELLEKELKGSYLFFIRENNFEKKLYGLVHDESKYNQDVSSIASVGFGLAALVIGTINGYLRLDEAKRICNNTLNTLLHELETVEGFFYHFVNLNTGKRNDDSEISIIDTGLLICCAIFAGEFFEGEIKEKVLKLYERVNWRWFLNKNSRQFYMGYSKKEGHTGSWDMYAEQLMLYFLAIASPTFSLNKEIYYAFERKKGGFGEIEGIIYSYFGSLFAYQYSHAFFDFRNKKDNEGTNWFENSRKATLANRNYCIENKNKFKTYGENSWVLTSCITKNGYKGNIGAKPCIEDVDEKNDGTIAISGAVGSIVFTPKEAISAMEYYYNNFPELWSDYGFQNSYNLDGEKPWFASENVGIDKGIGMCMIENYLRGSVWKYFMKNEFVKKSIEIIFN